VFGVALRIGAGLKLGLGLGVGGVGMKHLVWQLATCELQFIMHVVVVKVSGVCSPALGLTTLGVP